MNIVIIIIIIVFFVKDFLVTVYIQENFKDMNPGLMTDIRSALVNNSTLACLSVKYDFHKYLLYTSSPLNKCIENFVKIQISNNHAVNEQVMIIIMIIIMDFIYN